MYSEFAAATKCSNTEHNREVFNHLEALYMMSEMTKEEVYRIGRKLVVNPVIYNTKLGIEGGRYVFVREFSKYQANGYYTGTWAEVLDWDIQISTATEVYRLRKMDQKETAMKLYRDSWYSDSWDLVEYDSSDGLHCYDRSYNKAKIKWVE